MQKPEVKIDFKKEAKKVWGTIVLFARPYLNLNTSVLAPIFEPFLKKNIQIVYTVGSVALLVLAILSLQHFPAIFVILGQWIALVIIFVVFRLLCELIANCNKVKK